MLCHYEKNALEIKWCVFFFFQAEDGIRDLVRSRGLGDVYKRQEYARSIAKRKAVEALRKDLKSMEFSHGPTGPLGLTISMKLKPGIPVSYTHLTLPTSDLV